MFTAALKLSGRAMTWLIGTGVALAGAIGFYLIIAAFDPPWSVAESKGVVLGSAQAQNPKVAAHYYKMKLLVRTDDGRTIAVVSERKVSPSPGARVQVQERIALLGTRKFVEIPPP